MLLLPPPKALLRLGPGPAAHGEIDAMCSAGLSPSIDAALMAELREFCEDEGR